MSKKRRERAEEAEANEEDESGKNRDWIGEAILFVIGLWLIYNSNWNGLLIGIGSAFALSPVLQIPAIRIYINNKTGQQIFQVRQSHISGSNVVGSAREVHFHEAPRTIIQPQPVPETEKPKPQQDWEVDDEFTLTEEEDWRDFEFDLEDGEELVGSVEADGHVSCYVFGVASFRSFREEESFTPYWARTAVTKTKVSFVALGSRTYYFVVDNAEEEADVSVSVKLRVKN